MQRLAQRRHFFKAAAALGLASSRAGSLLAATDLPIADSHSHLGTVSRKPGGRSLKAEMEASGVMLLAWSIVGDTQWTKHTPLGIEQKSVPAGGEQAGYFRKRLALVREHLASIDLPYVRDTSDVDAARSGSPRIVIAIEGAGAAGDGLELLDESHAQGLRHVQLVHYIRNALGDFQTEAPQHNGLTQLGADVVRACNRLGMLVDLAHSTGAVIDKALEISKAPVIWSHSDITTAQYDWRQTTSRSRLLHLDYAKKIAAGGGAVGLWNLRSSVGNSPRGYTDELLRMVDAIGPDHVMFGTDMNGVGPYGTMSELNDLREVAELLGRRGIDDKTLRAICFENYARCLQAAMSARQP